MMSMRKMVPLWKEVLLVLVGTGLLALAATAQEGEKCTPGDKNTYVPDYDDCFSGGSGCTVVCG